MNVANRKLFANRDARQKLANMGGIMASSPELLGEAQKFAPGGQVTSDELRAALMRESATPDLRNALTDQFGLDAIREAESGMLPLTSQGFRPSASSPRFQRELESQGIFGNSPGRDMGRDITKGRATMIGGELFILFPDGSVTNKSGMEVQDPEIVTAVRSKLDSGVIKSADDAVISQIEALQSAPVNPSFTEDRPDVFPGDVSPLSQPTVPADGGLPRDIRDAPSSDLTMMQQQLQSLGLETDYSDPTQAPLPAQGSFSDVVDYGMGVAGDILSGTGDILSGPDLVPVGSVDSPLDSLKSEILHLNQGIESASAEGNEILAGTLSTRRDRLLRQMALMEANTDVQEAVGSIPTTVTRAMGDLGGKLAEMYQQYVVSGMDPAEAAAKIQSYRESQAFTEARRAEEDAAGIASEARREAEQEALAAGATSLSPGDLATPGPSTYSQDQQAEDMGLTRARAESEAAAEATKEEVTTEEPTTTDAPTTTPPPADASPLDTEEIVTTANDPDSSAADRNKKVTGKVLSGLGVPNADKMGINERVSTYEKLFKEMLGEKDEDVAKEMWHNMAMIGFSIAAGESPNALKNIASGLLEGTKMMREDRATRQAREDKIGMLALEAGMADKRAEEKYARDLALVGARASSKPTKGYLDTQSGQLIEKIYTDVMNDGTINEKDKVARFVQRVGGDQAKLFFAATGLPSDAGSTTTTTLDDIQ